MSQENVELVRSVSEAYIAGDIDAYADFMAENVEVHPDASRFPEAKPFRGREEFRRFVSDLDESGKAEIREVFPAGGRVVVRADWGGRGRASGIDLRSSLTIIHTIRDGQIIKIEYFFDHAEALKAAGLSE